VKGDRFPLRNRIHSVLGMRDPPAIGSLARRHPRLRVLPGAHHLPSQLRRRITLAYLLIRNVVASYTIDDMFGAW
jgi:hypothetical protein